MVPQIWLRGQPNILQRAPQADQPSGLRVTVVGSRSASALGVARATELGRALAAAGALVISGGALGIDAAAHRGALAASGKTLAVLGTGIDQVYPSCHQQLFADIAQTGCLLSAQPPGTPPRPGNFPRRNQLMAALADVVVVVEAQLRSGTGSTAQAARRRGCPVLCFADSPGTQALLAAGAAPVASIADVLAQLGQPVRAAAPPPAGQLPLAMPAAMDGDPGELFVVDAVGRRLLAALAHGPLDLGELGSRIGLSAADCAAAVIELEICGRCSRLPGGRVIGHAPLC